MNRICQIIEKNKEFINYSLVGVSLTIANWMLYSALVRIVPMAVANLFSWGIVVCLAYVGNKIFVFESRDWDIHTVLREMTTYFGARGVTGVVEVGAQPLLYHWGLNQPLFGVDGLSAKIVVSILVMVLNYSCTKLIVFRQTEKRSQVRE